MARFPSELQSLCGDLVKLPGNLAPLFSSGHEFGRWPDSIWQHILTLLASFDWAHDIWLHTEAHPRTVRSGYIDLIVNADLGGPDSYVANHYGLLIAAHEKGELLAPANRILFTIYLYNCGRNTLYLGVNGLLHKYEFIARHTLVVAAEAVEISAGDLISFGDRFPEQIPDDDIRERCVSLRDKMYFMNAGVAPNIVNLLARGGIFVYADFPNSHFSEALFLLGELKPIAHLVHCGAGCAKIPGGGDLLDAPVSSHDQRVSAFLYSAYYSEQLSPIVETWPRDIS